MKKLILFFGIIAVATMMTSCLEGNNSWEETTIVFIDRTDNGVMHGRASNGRFITSPAIRDGVLMGNPPIHFREWHFYRMHYRWEQELGFTSLGENVNANNVQVFEAIEIPAIWLTEGTAPEQTEDMQRFVGIPASSAWVTNPIFSDSEWYWRDNWILQFTWHGGAEAPQIGLFKRARDEASNTVDIDVRIIQPSIGSEMRERSGIVSFDMSRVRDSFPQTTTARAVTVRFHFYQTGYTTPRVITANTWTLHPTN